MGGKPGREGHQLRWGPRDQLTVQRRKQHEWEKAPRGVCGPRGVEQAVTEQGRHASGRALVSLRNSTGAWPRHTSESNPWQRRMWLSRTQGRNGQEISKFLDLLER